MVAIFNIIQHWGELPSSRSGFRKMLSNGYGVGSGGATGWIKELARNSVLCVEIQMFVFSALHLYLPTYYTAGVLSGWKFTLPHNHWGHGVFEDNGSEEDTLAISVIRTERTPVLSRSIPSSMKIYAFRMSTKSTNRRYECQTPDSMPAPKQK